MTGKEIEGCKGAQGLERKFMTVKKVNTWKETWQFESYSLTGNKLNN